jgi:NAD(P)-dependent dehydrogenase (short-subunit alcohol dehydrogenase family)
LLTKIDPKEWWGAIEVSLKGPYLLTRYLLPKMVKGGHVLNTSSIGADMITPNASGYQIAKFALNRLTEFTQAEFPDVECVCFHPGGVVTQLSSKTEAIRPCRLHMLPKL